MCGLNPVQLKCISSLSAFHSRELFAFCNWRWERFFFSFFFYLQGYFSPLIHIDMVSPGDGLNVNLQCCSVPLITQRGIERWTQDGLLPPRTITWLLVFASRLCWSTPEELVYPCVKNTMRAYFTAAPEVTFWHIWKRRLSSLEHDAVCKTSCSNTQYKSMQGSWYNPWKVSAYYMRYEVNICFLC